MTIRARHTRRKRWKRQERRAPRLKKFLDAQATRLGSTLDLDAIGSNTGLDPDTYNTNLTDHNLAAGDGPLRFTTAGTFPAPIVAGRNYYAVPIDNNDFYISSQQNGGNPQGRVGGSGALDCEFGSDADSIFHRLRRRGNTAGKIRAAAAVDDL